MQIHIFIEMIRKIVAMKYYNFTLTLCIFLYITCIIVSTNIFALSNFLQLQRIPKLSKSILTLERDVYISKIYVKLNKMKTVKYIKVHKKKKLAISSELEYAPKFFAFILIFTIVPPLLSNSLGQRMNNIHIKTDF